jgi:cell division protein FtsL
MTRPAFTSENQLRRAATNSHRASRIDGLEAFRDKVKQGRLIEFWTKLEELPGKVAISMIATIKTYPAVGWVRASHLDQTNQLLSELNDVRKQNERLQIEVRELRAQVEAPGADTTVDPILDPSGMGDAITIGGKYRKDARGETFDWEREFSWEDIFRLVGPRMLERPAEGQLSGIISDVLFGTTELYGNPVSIRPRHYTAIKVQLLAFGLIDIEKAPGAVEGSVFLTRQGRRLMQDFNSQRAERSHTTVADVKPDTTDV